MSNRSLTAAWFRHAPRVGLALSVLLFVACLFNDAYGFKSSGTVKGTPAFFVLLVGWYGVLVGGNIGWLANPALLGGWLGFIRGKRMLGLISTLLALALMLRYLVDPTVMLDENASQWQFDVYGLGYWLWLASAGTMLLTYAVAALPTDFLTPKEGSP
ncbi:hypothetical protein ACG04Q_02360 [Roseateles sp. DXS20W]|uniref:Transmembrane protein n=1 Tax=Pelomonas lactea TaxID=3299030 RepID=A0ABW7GEX1_9BURK